MQSSKEFQNRPLKDMVAVGAVGLRSVRLWLRSSLPGQVKIHWWGADQQTLSGETVVVIPENNEQDNPLQRYRFQAVHLKDDHLVGEGRFETAPEHPDTTPEKFSIALFSCHQPFDKRGRIHNKVEQMLRASLRCLEEQNTKFVPAMGDQMYSDLPSALRKIATQDGSIGAGSGFCGAPTEKLRIRMVDLIWGLSKCRRRNSQPNSECGFFCLDIREKNLSVSIAHPRFEFE